MLDIICTRKEKTRVILFFEIYKMVLIIFKSENCSYTGDPPIIEFPTPNWWVLKWRCALCHFFFLTGNWQEKLARESDNDTRLVMALAYVVDITPAPHFHFPPPPRSTIHRRKLQYLSSDNIQLNSLTSRNSRNGVFICCILSLSWIDDVIQLTNWNWLQISCFWHFTFQLIKQGIGFSTEWCWLCRQIWLIFESVDELEIQIFKKMKNDW